MRSNAYVHQSKEVTQLVISFSWIDPFRLPKENHLIHATNTALSALRSQNFWQKRELSGKKEQEEDNFPAIGMETKKEPPYGPAIAYLEQILSRPRLVDWMIDDVHRHKRNIECRFRFI